MKRAPQGILAVIVSVVLVACWLLCASESEAHHEGEETQPCVTCCGNHRGVPAAPIATLSSVAPSSSQELPLILSLHSQTVIRLLVPPPKSST